MLVSRYRSSHASRVDYKIFKKIVFGPWPLRLKLVLLRLAAPFARDRLRLLATRRYLEFLCHGAYRPTRLPRPQVYVTADQNLADDLAALAQTAPIVNLTVEWRPAPAAPVAALNPVWRPPLSGFFSTVYAVLCHRWVHGEAAVIDDQNWPYAVALADLIDCRIERQAAASAPHNAARAKIAADPLQQRAFEEFACSALERLHTRARAMLEQQGVALPAPGVFAVYFIRRGDKLNAESLDIPPAAYLRSLAERSAGPLLAIGDDDLFIGQLQRACPALQTWVPFAPIAGSTLERAVSRERTLSILVNFCILCQARELIGDPNCNLVAAAMAVRRQRHSADQKLFPWPRHWVI